LTTTSTVMTTTTRTTEHHATRVGLIRPRIEDGRDCLTGDMKETFPLGTRLFGHVERVDWTTVWAVGWCHVPGPEPRERAATPSTRYGRSENGRQDAERSESTLGGPRPPMSIGQDRNSCRNESKRQDWGNGCRAVEGSLGRALPSRRADLHRWPGRSSLRGVTLS
jgi:hypothetical protein